MEEMLKMRVADMSLIYFYQFVIMISSKKKNLDNYMDLILKSYLQNNELPADRLIKELAIRN